MKDIFRAAAQMNFSIKGISVLMLVMLVALGFTSCENQTAAPCGAKREQVLKVNPVDVTAPNGNEKQMFHDSETEVVDYKYLCIGGNTAGQERRGLVTEGIQSLPLNTHEIGGNETGRKLFAIGGNGAGSTLPRAYQEIGGSGITRGISALANNREDARREARRAGARGEYQNALVV